jgi:hypothetical protein
MTDFCRKVKGKVESDGEKFKDVSVEDCDKSSDITYKEVQAYITSLENDMNDI